MAAYVVANYRVTNPEGIASYPGLAGPTIMNHGGEILAADRESEVIEGSPAHTTVVLRFESKAAAKAWYDSPDYQQIRHLRTDNSEGFVVLCDGFVLPS